MAFFRMENQSLARYSVLPDLNTGSCALLENLLSDKKKTQAQCSVAETEPPFLRGAGATPMVQLQL